MSNPKLETLIEEYVSKIITEIFDDVPKELNVYDFDDTIVRAEGVIHLVNKKTGERRELSPQEFQTYDVGKDEQFDLSDFSNLLNPTTLPHFERMKADYQRLGPNGVAICTARPYSDSIIKFMADNGMPDIEIVAVGEPVPTGNVSNANARKKQDYLRNKIAQRNLQILRFFDDNRANCRAAKALAKEFPGVQIEVENVK